MFRLILFLVCIGCFTTCIKPPEYPVEPVIEFVRLSKTEVLQAIDTFRLTFAYTDGDGDIGLDFMSENPNIVITDSRTGFQEFYNLPEVPEQGVSNGISGEISMTLFASCCLDSSPICLPTPGLAPEEIIYTVQMYDQAGNASNIIESTLIQLICD